MPHTLWAENIQHYWSPDGLIAYAQAFKEEVEELPPHIAGRFRMEIYAQPEGDSAYVEDNQLVYTYDMHRTQERFDATLVNAVARKVRETVTRQLYQEVSAVQNTTSRSVGCASLALFREGGIDWNALRRLVYSDCTI